jgi:DNA-binding CsgD family transcriptional regulator
MFTTCSHENERRPAVAADMTMDQIRELVLDEISIGLIVCDCSGFLRFANRSAEEQLACGTWLRRVGQTLRCGGASHPSFEDTLRAGGRTCRHQLVELSHGADRLLVSVVPMARDFAREFAHEPLMLIMFGCRQLCTTEGLERLSALHALTAAEHRVLVGLLNEKTPHDIALAHAVALTTVRTQIASIQSKFEVHSVEALLRRVAEVPPALGALQDVPDSQAPLRAPGAPTPRPG